MARTDANPPNVETGSGAPATTPKRVGDIYIDLLSKDSYQAVGTVDASGWVQTNSVVASVAWGALTGTLSDQTDLQSALDGKSATGHTHVAANISDFDTEVGNQIDVAANTAARHSHTNLALLETYTQTEVNLADAVTKRHDHSNKATLDLITAAYTIAEQTKVGHISVTQAVDLDQMELDIAALDAAVVLQGVWDASVGTFPGGGTAQSGASYIVSVGGTVDGVVFTANDRIVAVTDNASTTTYAANWHKLDYTDAVLSVNSQTGAVVLDADDIDDTSTAHKFVTAADLVVLSNTSGTNSGDNAVNTLYSSLVSNATHTGEVTGATTLTVNPTAISNKTLVTAATGDMVLIWDATDSTLKRVNASDFLAVGFDNTTATVTFGTGAATSVIQSNGNFNLTLQTGNATTGSITIVDGADGDITLAPNGTGQVIYGSDEVAIVAGKTSVASDSTPNPVGSKERNEYYLTALAAAATIAAPSGTPANGNSLIIRIKDNGTARALTWNAIYRAIGVTLPTITVISKTMYIGCKYNSTDSKWDVIAVAEEA